ncbi:hypothetical protein ASZ90_009141 [hydrocarbon metagenome]|uniref:Squalene cyclase C-terminal domain-containing protein n=1 Tax=hydrocarbon metagenome TaxID=938273 RepID=A0A0W8FJP8_9ZZZZ
MLDEVFRNLVVLGDAAYVRDPVFGIVRNRVNAEVAKTLMRMGDGRYVGEIATHIVRHQNPDGSWNEVHVNYSQPSALITSFIGDALLYAESRHPYGESIDSARKYVLSQEKRPGFFVKSAGYTADHLNADASCGAFLAHYGAAFDDPACLEAAERAAGNVCSHQEAAGAYPYAVDRGTYPYTFAVPCIHYQGVTLYYLTQIQEILDVPWIEESLQRGVEWLASVQQADGRFDWSKSGLMFAYYLSGAYAFAFSSFLRASRRDPGFLTNAELCLHELARNTDGLLLRWESGGWREIVPSLHAAARTASIGEYPLRHRAFRFGYGMYRQVARRRRSRTADTRAFRLLCRALNIRASTVEPSKNFPDLFMTSEALDCLSRSYTEGAYA